MGNTMTDGNNEDFMVLSGSIIGFPPRHILKRVLLDRSEDDVALNVGQVSIGENPLIRPFSIIYADVEIGDNFECGHNVVIRENTKIGNNTRVGTGTIIEGDVEIGDDVNIQSMVYIPKHTFIGDSVFIGPCAVITNDKYPPHAIGGLSGVTIHEYASIGANATILPGVTIGDHAMVAAGAVVTKDVLPYSLAISEGSRASVVDIPIKLRERL